ncbi:protein YhfH [Paenibacillus sp.]|uniref:protein YhfH n=1 Tax=Paenibacillus sp. TaxID=58172 RepID=UPI000FD9A220
MIVEGFMMMKSTRFLETLEPKCCEKCGQSVEQLADCHTNVCFQCNESNFYPLSPVNTNKPFHTVVYE